MKTVLLLMTALVVSNLSVAQVGSTASQGASATAEKAKQYGDQTKAAVSSQPDKTIDKAKARVHKAKAAVASPLLGEYHLAYVDIAGEKSGLAIGEIVLPKPPEAIVES